MTAVNYRSDLSGDEKVMMAVVRAAEIFKRAISVIFRNYDLSFPSIISSGSWMPQKAARSRITEVSRIMLVAGANMTGLAKRLEKNGFIRRKSDSNDERV